MSIFWQRDPYSYRRSREENYALKLAEWINHTWKQITFPLKRCEIPVLPGLYSLYGRFKPCHLDLPILYCQKQDLRIGEALPNWITEEQRRYGFNVFLYIGTSQCLYARWESHEKSRAIDHLFKNGVGVDFYFYAMPPTETIPPESKADSKSRKNLEKKLIRYLCPILCN